MFIVKKHQGPHGIVLVVTDKEILGKKFEENNLQLDLTKEFYQGEELNKEQVKEKIKEAYILHLTGEKTIQLFLDLGFVDSNKILIISKIPHAEVYLEEN